MAMRIGTAPLRFLALLPLKAPMMAAPMKIISTQMPMISSAEIGGGAQREMAVQPA